MTEHDRFWAKIERSDGCWLWTSAVHCNGYGEFHIGGRKGRTVKAHRYVWESANGPIPPGLYVCHHCDNKRCVRPDHLFLGTALDNTRDMIRKGRAWQYQPRAQCVHGHALTPENVYVAPRSGLRSCRECKRCQKRQRRRDQRAAA